MNDNYELSKSVKFEDKFLSVFTITVFLFVIFICWFSQSEAEER